MMKKMRKIVFVGFAFPHHKNTYGGYHHIVDYLPYNKMIDIQSWFDSSLRNSMSLRCRILRKLCRIMIGENTIPFYLLRILWLSLFNRNVTFHIVYGENIMHRLLWKCVLGNKVVCTLHQPYEWFEEQPVWHKYLKKIDAVILMSKDEIHLFEQLTGKDNVYFIPHGICTNFYHLPHADEIVKNNSILMVGNWLRDFDFANSVFCKVLKNSPNSIINVVCNEEHWSKFYDSRIHCFCNLSDEGLRNLYWQSSVVFLPLLRFTANNALLESTACGCNIVIASPQVENSYIPKNMFTIVPLDEQICVDVLLKGVNNSTFRDTISFYVNQNYSWNVIAEKTKKILMR